MQKYLEVSKIYKNNLIPPSETAVFKYRRPARRFLKTAVSDGLILSALRAWRRGGPGGKKTPAAPAVFKNRRLRRRYLKTAAPAGVIWPLKKTLAPRPSSFRILSSLGPRRNRRRTAARAPARRARGRRRRGGGGGGSGGGAAGAAAARAAARARAGGRREGGAAGGGGDPRR